MKRGVRMKAMTCFGLLVGMVWAGSALAQQSDAPSTAPDSAFGQQGAKVMAVPFTPRNVWQADRDASTARLFVGRETNPFLFNAAVARVSGNVVLDPHRPGEGAVEVTIYPAGNGQAPVHAQGRLGNGAYPNSADYAEMTFRSAAAQLRSDGQWQAAGELTLIRVVRPATTDPSEAYAGPVYGSPEVSTVTRKAVFVFSSRPAMSNHAARVIGTAQVEQTVFPELKAAVLDAEWPQVVQHENCVNSATAAEDYAGPTCTGEVVAASSLPARASVVSEDFHGMQPRVPAGNAVTVRVEMVAGRELAP